MVKEGKYWTGGTLTATGTDLLVREAKVTSEWKSTTIEGRGSIYLAYILIS